MEASSGSAPRFGVVDAASSNDNRTINLDDVFSDCFFGPVGEVIASTSTDGPSQQQAGGAYPHPPPMPPPLMPAAVTSSSSFTSASSSSHNYGEAAADEDDDEDEFDEDGKSRKRPRNLMRQMSEQQKVERRERNREHAKRSRVRKKFLLESLQQSVNALTQENEKLRAAIKQHLGSPADELLASCSNSAVSLIASNPSDATRILDDPDYSLVKALQTAQQNFVITDPSLPDNPIVFASQGFLTLTGYTLDQVLGRNCRFLQGPLTDPRAVHKIRKAVADGIDSSVCLLNYKIDGTTFWNQFFVAPLRDSEGNVVNYVGVQCKVSDDFARAIAQKEGAEAQPDP